MTSFTQFSSLLFLFFFFFCAAFFPFRRAKEDFRASLRIFLFFVRQTVVKDLKRVSGSRKQKKTERKKKILLLLCVRVKCRRTLDSLCNKNYTDVIIKLSLTKKSSERERGKIKPSCNCRKTDCRTTHGIYTRRPVINACIWRGKETV